MSEPKPNPYMQAVDMLHQLAHAPLNDKQPGGLQGQIEQLYGLAGQVFTQFAKDHTDATFYSFISILKKARGDE